MRALDHSGTMMIRCSLPILLPVQSRFAQLMGQLRPELLERMFQLLLLPEDSGGIAQGCSPNPGLAHVVVIGTPRGNASDTPHSHCFPMAAQRRQRP